MYLGYDFLEIYLENLFLDITVAFQSSLYTVNEGDGSLNVTIEASGALKDSYPLVFSATMGTAEGIVLAWEDILPEYLSIKYLIAAAYVYIYML